MIIEIDHFSFSLKKQIRTPKKIYSIDTGQANAMGFQFSTNKGRLLENLILIELKRSNFDLYYYRGINEKKVDFVIKKGAQLCLMQVCWNLDQENTKEREIASLKSAMSELHCNKAILIVEEPPLHPIQETFPIIEAHHFLCMSSQGQQELFFG